MKPAVVVTRRSFAGNDKGPAGRFFVATTIGDYKVMAEDMQELKRYIKQMGEVVIYYREVTTNDAVDKESN